MDNIIRFPASYNKDLPAEYLGNPYIEALPEMMDKKSYFETVMFLPRFDKTFRNEPDHFRKVKIVETYKYVVPNEHYYDLYKTLWRMLFTTYTDRNSFDTEAVKEHYTKLLLKKKMDRVWTGTTGESLLLTAPSGFGKSMMVRRILLSLTQVIDHEVHEGKKFRQPQILWIYLKIPSNANRRSLCHLFLSEVDRCAGTDYAQKTPESTLIGNYERIFRTIIETYKLGLLVVDEMQNLTVSKAGGDQEFLNFFSELSEQWRLGLVLIGTPNIIPILEKTFSAGRRLTSGGDKHYERYAIDSPIWEGLVKALWPYQYVNTQKELYDAKRLIVDRKLYEEIYKLTQGIPFVFTFLFIHAQMIAIESPGADGNEVIGVGNWRRAYNESSTLIRAAIEDIRATGGKSYPDLMHAAQYQCAPEKTAFIVELQAILTNNSIPPKIAKTLRVEISAFEKNYVLNEKEQAIIDKVKQLNFYEDIAGPSEAFIDGECEVVN
ncbi:ATP-binding protein [Rheinheimera sp. 1928-s]|uniref:ATP-binding protein n=1 Tax=Rheinheimera sp. 1928-s TaxID=3033803 RepID=UPI0026373559|nr:ATP-binding protein [Rheinheimera sp. 1928-s]MDF3123495.1 ATP-binding protein [Rheinheimera sp. 1928-s]